MIRKILDVRTFRNGEVIDALSSNKADANILISILNISEPGDEITVIVKPVNPISHE